MTDQPQTAVEVLDADRPASEAQLEQLGVVPSRNYREAIEIGHVAAASNLYPEARTAARAAMVVMIGMDLGVSPAAALMGIHIMESSDGKVNFLIEGKILGKLVKDRAPAIDYKVIARTDESAELEFLRDGQLAGPNITWTKETAVRAGLWGKAGPWKNYPREMLTWRALAEGVRIYFPEVIGGQRVYVEGELGESGGSYREALEGPKAPSQLDDGEAEEIRAEAEEVFRELAEINPERLLRTRFQRMLRSSGHSHTELRNTVGGLRELLEAEKRYQALCQQLVEKAGPEGAKEPIARAERRSSAVEREDVMTKALEEAEAKTTEEGSSDGE